MTLRTKADWILWDSEELSLEPSGDCSLEPSADDTSDLAGDGTEPRVLVPGLGSLPGGGGAFYPVETVHRYLLRTGSDVCYSTVHRFKSCTVSVDFQITQVLNTWPHVCMICVADRPTPRLNEN